MGAAATGDLIISFFGIVVFFKSASGTFPPILPKLDSKGFARGASRFETRSNVSMLANLENALSARDVLGSEVAFALAPNGFDSSELNVFMVKIAGSVAGEGAT